MKLSQIRHLQVLIINFIPWSDNKCHRIIEIFSSLLLVVEYIASNPPGLLHGHDVPYLNCSELLLTRQQSTKKCAQM